tara:strand:- start:2054 stop:3244 length:1191 start_codon:yes stop_codon:yes gene_type:complete
MRKRTIILLASVFSVAANAETVQDVLNSKVTQKPSTINLQSPATYSAEGVSDYEGRNENRASENLTSQVSSGSSVSKIVKLKNSAKNSQLENLESTAGELVQKLEDDRLKKAKKHKNTFDSSKNVLQNTYTTLQGVDINKLGSEQDLKIQNAFKCLDLRSCNDDPNLAKGTIDSRAIKNSCEKNERLHWNGSKWNCVGIFATIKPSSCGSKQYAKEVNGGTACIDYVYEWGQSGYTSCDSSGNKEAIVKCYQKKNLGDANKTSVSDSNCLRSKPKANTEKCTFSATYKCDSGWSLSGTKCTKTGVECFYEPGVKYWYISMGGCQVSHNTGYWNRKRVRTPYFKGELKEYRDRSCRSGDHEQYYKYFEICKNTTKTVDAKAECPRGYSYNSSTKKCQ